MSEMEKLVGRWAGADLPAQGRGRGDGTRRRARAPEDQAGLLTYGPKCGVSLGRYLALIGYQADGGGGDPLGSYDIGFFCASYSLCLAQNVLPGRGFQELAVEFDVPGQDMVNLEIRVRFHGQGSLELHYLELRYLGPLPADWRGGFSREEIQQYQRSSYCPNIRPDGSPSYQGSRHSRPDFLAYNQSSLAAYLAAQRAAQISADYEAAPLERPCPVKLVSKVSTQADLESDWAGYWGRELKFGQGSVLSRKRWEYVFVLQALFNAGLMGEGRHGLGLACGRERIPSFLAACGCRITAGDKPLDGADEAGNAWRDIGQYTASRDDLYHPQLLDRARFDELVRLKYIDMTRLPVDELAGRFDFCWSICAMEHLGTIELGLEFVKNTLRLLKPGGLSVHTTEYNLSDRFTVSNNPGFVLFQKEHFQRLALEIAELGGVMLGPDFDPGHGFWDHYFDLSKWYDGQYFDGFQGSIPFYKPHQALKLELEGFPVTCFGLIIQKRP